MSDHTPKMVSVPDNEDSDENDSDRTTTVMAHDSEFQTDVEGLAHALADDEDFQQDVVTRGLHEAIVEGDHGYAVDDASADMLVSVLLDEMDNTLREFSLPQSDE